MIENIVPWYLRPAAFRVYTYAAIAMMAYSYHAVTLYSAVTQAKDETRVEEQRACTVAADKARAAAAALHKAQAVKLAKDMQDYADAAIRDASAAGKALEVEIAKLKAEKRVVWPAKLAKEMAR